MKFIGTVLMLLRVQPNVSVPVLVKPTVTKTGLIKITKCLETNVDFKV